MIKDVNIIIIGGHGGSKDVNANDNNPQQADIKDLLKFKKDMSKLSYNVDITCIDPCYESTNIIENAIYFIKDFYNLGDTHLFSKESHNIIIDFCNMLNENHVNHGEINQQYDKMILYKDYKFTWISCGCLWDKMFPSTVLQTVIENRYYTPVQHTVGSFEYAINVNLNIKENNIAKEMLPYSQGIYQSLGTLMYRGCKSDNFISENVLRDLFIKIGKFFNNEEIDDFVNNKKHWNFISRPVRILATEYIYGKYIDYS